MLFSEFEGLTKNGKKKVDCWSDKNIIKPNEITCGSNKKFWFNCDFCLHLFESVIYNITKKKYTWCPYCSTPSRKLCENVECNFCLKNSFASFQEELEDNKLKIDCWSDKNNLKPRNVLLGSHQEIIFECHKCNHSFKKEARSIIKSWCPYCANQKLCEDENCLECFNKSLASFVGKTKKGNNIIDLYSDENELNPRNIFLNCSYLKVIFNCDNCPHIFSARLDSITKNGTWCPYCCEPCQKLCENEKCDFCYKNSFASFQGKTINGKLKIDCWSNENELKPRNIVLKSEKNTYLIVMCAYINLI